MCYGENCVLLIALACEYTARGEHCRHDCRRGSRRSLYDVGDALAMRWRCMPILCTGEGQREPWPLHTQRYAQD